MAEGMDDATPLAAVVLAGGASRRMGREKALLTLPDGRTALEAVLAAACAVAHPVLLAVDTAEHGEQLRRALPDPVPPLLLDSNPGAGPLCNPSRCDGGGPRARPPCPVLRYAPGAACAAACPPPGPLRRGWTQTHPWRFQWWTVWPSRSPPAMRRRSRDWPGSCSGPSGVGRAPCRMCKAC